MFIDAHSVKDVIIPHLATMKGRSELIESYVTRIRCSLTLARTTPDEVPVLAAHALMIEAILSRCDGTETFDKVAVQGLLGDLKSLGSEALKQLNEDKDALAFVNTVVDGIRTATFDDDSDIPPSVLEIAELSEQKARGTR